MDVLVDEKNIKISIENDNLTIEGKNQTGAFYDSIPIESINSIQIRNNIKELEESGIPFEENGTVIGEGLNLAVGLVWGILLSLIGLVLLLASNPIGILLLIGGIGWAIYDTKNFKKKKKEWNQEMKEKHIDSKRIIGIKIIADTNEFVNVVNPQENFSEVREKLEDLPKKIKKHQKN